VGGFHNVEERVFEMNKLYWVRVREQVQIAQVIVCVQALGELGFLSDKSLELDPAFIAESLVKGVSIDGCIEERDEIREAIEESAKKAVPAPKTSKVVKPAVEEVPVPTCPECGAYLVLRRGKFGEFWGCPNFIDGCRGKATIKA
jgi:hypothetical protein